MWTKKLHYNLDIDETRFTLSKYERLVAIFGMPIQITWKFYNLFMWCPNKAH